VPAARGVQAWSRAIRNFLNRISYGKTHGSIELSGLALENLVLPWDDLQSKLQALVLSRNQLAAMPSEADQCTCLTALWIDSNALTTLPHTFGKLCALKSLALDLNQLAALPACVCDLTALERLTLDNNVLRFLHPRMSELHSLTLLSAANNRLTMLPASLATISCLRSLTLAGNPLAPLPPALRDRHDIIWTSRKCETACATACAGQMYSCLEQASMWRYDDVIRMCARAPGVFCGVETCHSVA